MADSTQPGEDYETKKAKKAEYRRKWYQSNREQVLEKQRQYRERNKDAVLARGRAYYQANKERISESSKAYREQNKDAISKRRRQQYLQNSETIKQRARDYRLRDVQAYRSRHQESQKKWRAKNKDKVRAIYCRHMKKKRRTDPLFWVKCVVRERICGALSRVSSRKSNRTLDLVGCTVADLARHLESKFLPGMTWENRGAGGWHVDHIIPLAKFDLSDPFQQAAAFHYTNLQPLWAQDNIRKHANAPGQNLFGFAYAAKIADAASAKPKRRRRHGGQHGGH